MKKVIIIHGFGGVPNGGWLPWLIVELGKKGIYAYALAMPNTENPMKEEWVAEIAHAVGNSTEEVFLIGHSLGATATLRYLETLSEGEFVAGALLIAGLTDPLDTENPQSRFSLIDNFFLLSNLS